MLTVFDYRLTGTGWAEMVLSNDVQQARVHVSYMSEPLPELLQALMRMLKGQSVFERVNFDNEGSEYDLLLTKIDCVLRIEIIENAYFVVLDPDMDDRCPMPVFTTYTYLRDFCEEVVRGLRKLLATMGAAGYNELWASDPFPEEDLNALAALL